MEDDLGVFDEEFINDKTAGYDALISDLQNDSLDDLISQSGIDKEKIIQAIDLLAPAKKIIIC